MMNAENFEKSLGKSPCIAANQAVHQNNLDILAERSLKLNPDLTIEKAKDKATDSLKVAIKICKILKFSHGWTFDEVMREITRLYPVNYENLFVFIINVNEIPKIESLSQEEPANENYVKSALENNLSSFCKSRQIIIQLTSEKDNETKIFYNHESTMRVLHEITRDGPNNENFPSFLRVFSRFEYESREQNEEAIFNMLQNPDNLTLRFLTIFKTSSEFSTRVILHCAANFSLSTFFAALGTPKRDDDEALTEAHIKMLKTVFNNQKYKSILEASIANSNREIFDYLKKSCYYLIVRLPYDHQIEIANQLVNEEKYELLCDLLESSDFPFPTEIEFASIDDKRFQKIVSEREKFHEVIENGNDEYINDFIEMYYEKALEIVHNTNNKSALYTAVKAGKTDVFCRLKDKQFRGREKDLNDLRCQLMMVNVKTNALNPEKAVDILTGHSKIFNKYIDQFQFQWQHEKIKTWLTDISKTKYGGSLLNVAAQCQDLQIIFDFKSYYVDRVDLDSRDADGITYRDEKLIIIGAKHSTKDEEQTIKGTLAHELTHYVLRMIFENNEKPYFNEFDMRYQKFQDIVRKYKYLENKSEDDGCDEIVSSVYRDYKEKDYDAELIVRIFHIIAQFDDKPEKQAQLLRSFKELDDFIEVNVIPLMSSYNLKEMNFVTNLNNYARLLSNIRKINLQFPTSETVKGLFNKKITIATTNVPKLVLIEIYNHLLDIYGNLVSAKNVFLTQENFTDQESLQSIIAIFEKMNDVNIIADFSCGNIKSLQTIDLPSNRNVIIVLSNKSQSGELIKMLKTSSHSQLVTIDYEWNNLDAATQIHLLKHKISFQNTSKIPLLDIFGSERNLSQIIDNNMLNMILDNSDIPVNRNIGLDENKNFTFLFRERNYTRNEEKEWQKISQEKLIEENKDKKYVLISDVAGSGKSWVMRNLALEIARTNKSKWVTSVDLKRFIPYFQKCLEGNKEPSIYDFMVMEVLKKNTKLEVEIFKAKYEAGEVAIMFDGFDEIAPDCAGFVLNVINTFKSNGHNQLFVSTRDYFKIELRTKLAVNFVYKLVGFWKYDGSETIAKIWRLNDLQHLTNIDFEKDVIRSDEFKLYQELAKEVVNKLPGSWIVLPQIFSMIAKVTKEKKRLDENLSTYLLYREMYLISYDDWIKEKGELRGRLNAKTQGENLNFLKMHELKAMQRFAPGRLEYCDVDPDEKWDDVNLGGCGLMTKYSDGEFYFIHETFHEYFVAEFIVRNLRFVKKCAEAFEFMLKVFFEEHEVIRKFLNEALEYEILEAAKGERSFFDKDKDKRIQKFDKIVDEKLMIPKDIYHAFVCSLRDFNFLGNFLLDILKRLNYEKFKESLAEGVKGQITSEDELCKISRKSQKTFVDLISSCIDIQTLTDVADKVAETTTPTFIKDVLEYSDENNENIFWMLATWHISKDKMEKIIKFMQKFLSPTEIVDKMQELNVNGENIFHRCIKSGDYHELEIFWECFENFFKSEFSFNEFKVILVKKETAEGFTILHNIVQKHNVNRTEDWKEFYDGFWKLLVKTFENDREGLIKLILEPDTKNRTFVQILMEISNLERLEIVLATFKSTFSKIECMDILKLKLNNTKSLLYYYILDSNNTDANNIMMEFLIYSTETAQELVNFFIDSDFDSNNFLLWMMFMYEHDWKALGESFRNELKAAFLKGDIKKLFFNFNKTDSHMLKLTSLFEDGFEFLKKISPGDSNVSNEEPSANSGMISASLSSRLLQSACSGVISLLQRSELVRSTLSSLISTLISIRLVRSAIAGLISIFQRIGLFRSANFGLISTFLSSEIAGPDNAFYNALIQSMLLGELHTSLYSELCKLVPKKFPPDTILNILEHKDGNGNNLILTLVKFGLRVTAEKTCQVVQDVGEQVGGRFKSRTRELFRERNLLNENILHLAASTKNCSVAAFLIENEYFSYSSEDIITFIKEITSNHKEPTILFNHTICENIECHKKLWETLLEAFKDPNELKSFLMHRNKYESIFAHSLINQNKSFEVIRFTFETLTNTLSETQFNEVLMAKDSDEHTLLHLALIFSKDIEIFKYFWQHFKSLEDSSNFIMEADSNGRNILHYAAWFSTNDILDFIHEEMKGSNANVKEAVLAQDQFGYNIMMLGASSNRDRKSHESLWNLVRTFASQSDILKLINSTNKYRENILQISVRNNTKEVVEYIWNQIESSMTKEEQNEYLKLKNSKGKDLMELASKNLNEEGMSDLVRTLQTF